MVEIDNSAVSAASKITIECDHLVKGQEIQFEANTI